MFLSCECIGVSESPGELGAESQKSQGDGQGAKVRFRYR